MACEIPLTRDKVAIVDDADYEWLSQWKWHYNAATGYAARSDWQGKRYVLMHRIIVETPAGMDTDHINRNKLDNRRENLRIVTRRQNVRYARGLPGTASRFKGLSFYDNRFHVRIFVGGRNRYYGRFIDEHAAAQVYDYAARKHYGSFAHLNLPDEPLTDSEFFALTNRVIETETNA